MDPKTFPPRTIIMGMTEHEGTFRPSDWAERLQASIATYGNQSSGNLQNCMSTAGVQRMPSFSPKIRIRFQGGVKCVVVDRELWDTNPSGYEFLLNFAKENRLKVVEDWAEETRTPAV
ncbi:conserved hypothetical protein [Gammaproteobacteria bacterium]